MRSVNRVKFQKNYNKFRDLVHWKMRIKLSLKKSQNKYKDNGKEGNTSNLGQIFFFKTHVYWDGEKNLAHVPLYCKSLKSNHVLRS